MGSIGEIYKRFFGGLKFLLAGGLLLVAAESSVPFVVAALGRYTVDEILELDLLGPKNGLDDVANGPGVSARLERGEVGRVRPVQVAEAGDVLGVHEEALVEARTDRLSLVGYGRARGAELTEALILKRGKARWQKMRLLLLVFGATMIVYVLHGAGKVGHKYLLARVGEQVVFRLRRGLHKKLQQLPMSYHDQHEKGRLMARVIDDVGVIRRMSVHLSTSLTVNLCMVVVGMVVIFLINVRLALVASVSLPLFGLVYSHYRVRMKKLWRYLARQRASIYGLVGDRLASPETVKSFGQERRETIRLFRRARELLRGEVKQIWLSGFLGLWRMAVCGVSTAIVLGYGMLMVREGSLSIGYLLFFYGSLSLMYKPVADLGMLVPMMQRFRISADRVLEILDEEVTIRDLPGAIVLPSVAGVVRMNQVWLRYEGGEEAALRGIDLKIESGQHACLMGPSGSGKTSLVSVLLRLYQPSGGTIHLDGRELQEITVASLREHVAYVPQDAFLFSGTVGDNIRYGNLLASSEQVENAAKAAELHDFVISLPNGYDTIVGERGVTLSGGQRQRVSLARALLTDPRVLILDDCTSALDAITEARIIKTLRTALAGRTTIAITHRVSMSSRADKVIVLKQGAVAEVGSHGQLLNRQGLYYDLVAEQLAERHLRVKSGRALSAAS